MYAAFAGTFHPYEQRALPLMISVALAFLTVRARRPVEASDPENTSAPSTVERAIPWYDWVFAALAIPVFGYAALYPDYLANRFPMTRMSVPTTWEIMIACAAILLLLEAVRRTVGGVLVIVVAATLAYAFWGEHIPWRLMSHSGVEFVDLLDHLFLTFEGIWGTALGIAATYIALFVIFGAMMEKGGGSQFFIDLANAIAGERRGGPAKVVIFSSAMVGSVTGSTVANVYTTGQLTIPMMKQVGYRPTFAGAVEALASNGGQLMPPVMGAAAFILASYAGVSYGSVMASSLVPALLYFAMLLWFIHLEALKRNLVGLPKGSAPALLPTLLRGGHLIAPLVLLVVLLARGNSPMPSALYAILLMVAVSWVRPETRIGPRKFLEALVTGARNSIMIIVICAAIGIIIGVFTLTGLGLNVSSAIVNLSGGHFLLLLVLIAAAAIVLGTGMNTVAAFVLVSVVAVPALRREGVDTLTAHMFVFYLSLLSMITPPVCLAVFAGASIAGANPWATAFTAMKLGIVAYLLPFLIIYSPGLLLMGGADAVAFDILRSAAGATILVSGVQGWLLGRLKWHERAMASAGGLAMLAPDLAANAVGLALSLALIAWCAYGARQSRVTAAHDPDIPNYGPD